jgi:hypothetical protein
MKMRTLMLAAGLAALAGPGLAQGTFNPGGSNSGWKSGYGARPASPGFAPPPQRYGATPPATQARPPSYGSGGFAMPVQPGEAYKPRTYGSGSVYGQPRSPSRQRGATPCETSVYINACDP